MTGGNPFGYLQAWLRIWTCYYLEQIHLAIRAGLELRALDCKFNALTAQKRYLLRGQHRRGGQTANFFMLLDYWYVLEIVSSPSVRNDTPNCLV